MIKAVAFAENMISFALPFAFLMICGVFLTFKTRFIQVRKFPSAVKLTAKAFKNNKNSKEITSYKSACNALSSTVGTGNIIGVAAAINIGGPGAVFWMWVSAILGMCIKYFEITLSVKFREKRGNEFVGGPMYYIKNCLGGKYKILGLVFCISAVFAVFSTGNITQTNAAVSVICKTDSGKLILGLIFFTLTLLSTFGAYRRAVKITEKILPVMSFIYIFLCLYVILSNCTALPHALGIIIKGAFNPKAVTGGAVAGVWQTVFTGASKGVFSNEAGLGTSAMAHSAAVDANPDTQGLFGIFEVFADTLVLCSLTALTILCGGVKIGYTGYNSSGLVLQVFSKNFGAFGDTALAVMMFLFTFSSIVGWSVYGKMCFSFLFKKSGIVFDTVYPLCCILGAVFGSSFAWRLSAFANGIMLCVNLTALLLMSGKIQFRKVKK